MNKNVKKVMMMLFLVGFTFVILSDNVFAVEAPTDGNGTDSAVSLCNAIPKKITDLIGTIVNIIKIGVPIILIIMGMLDLGKAVASQKEDEIKKGQKTLISRAIAAGMVFFVVAIVQFLIGLVSGNTSGGKNTVWNCVAKLVGA